MDNETMDIQNFTMNGECSNCGSCCTDGLPMSSKEVKAIKNYIKKHKVKEHKNLIYKYDLSCPFRNNVLNRCDIYPVRPEICRTFTCNRPIHELEKEKKQAHMQKSVILMRKEFFGSTQYNCLLQELGLE